MATIKSYTDLEQSKKLAKILPLESADMEYMFLKKDGSKVSNVPFVKDRFEEPECCYTFIPCWSLAALLDVLPRVDIEKEICSDDTYDYRVKAYIGDGYIGNWYDSPIDACYEMILKLHELKIL